MKKKNKNLMVLYLNNDQITKEVTTFRNSVNGAIVAVIMPSDFKEWESVSITYKKRADR